MAKMDLTSKDTRVSKDSVVIKRTYEQVITREQLLKDKEALEADAKKTIQTMLHLKQHCTELTERLNEIDKWLEQMEG